MSVRAWRIVVQSVEFCRVSVVAVPGPVPAGSACTGRSHQGIQVLQHCFCGPSWWQALSGTNMGGEQSSGSVC